MSRNFVLQISTNEQFIDWMQYVFVPFYFADETYAGQRLPWKKRAFMDDGSNYRLGAARLRQLRMPTGGKFTELIIKS